MLLAFQISNKVRLYLCLQANKIRAFMENSQNLQNHHYIIDYIINYKECFRKNLFMIFSIKYSRILWSFYTPKNCPKECYKQVIIFPSFASLFSISLFLLFLHVCVRVRVLLQDSIIIMESKRLIFPSIFLLTNDFSSQEQ